MQPKPLRWNISPALIDPAARDLWKGLAFVSPLWGGAGKGALLGPHGGPLAGANLVAGSTLQWRATPYGLGFGRTGTGNALILSQNNFAPIVTSNGVGTGDFTFLLLANPIAEAVITSGGGQSVDGGVSAFMAIHFNANTGGSATSGHTLFYTRDTANGTITVGAASTVDGGYHLFGGMRKSTAVSVWSDGWQRSIASGTARNIFVSGTSDFALGSTAVTGASAIKDTTNIVFAAAWNRALSGAEMRLLARDPFAMFRPAPEWRGVWTPLGGGDVVLQPTDILDSPSFEAATFSQSHLFSAQEPNCLFAFEAATLTTGSVPPGFRSSAIGVDARTASIAKQTQSLGVAAGNRSRSITE